MYLLEQDYKKIDNPWPMIIIEDVLPTVVANHMKDNWPVHNDRLKTPYLDDPVFAKFYQVNFKERSQDIIRDLDRMFDQESKNVKLNHLIYIDQIDTERKLTREFHTDNLKKKYHLMFYIGDAPGGEFEACNKHGDILTLPYQHNRLIIWHNTEQTMHRWYSAIGSRKTMSIAVNYIDR